MRSNPGGLATLLAALALLAAVPPADAQVTPPPSVELEVVPHDEFLTTTEIAVLIGHVHVRCEAPGLRQDPMPFHVALNATADDPELRVLVKPAGIDFALDPARCADGEILSEEIEISIATSRSAPAGRVSVTLTATPDEGRQVSQGWEQWVAPNVLFDAHLERSVWKAGPNTHLELPLIIENQGNDEIQVRFKLGENSSSALNVALPALQVYPVGGTGTVFVALNTPFKNGYVDRNDTIEVIVEATSGSFPDWGFTGDRVAAQVNTVGAFAPGPGPLLAMVLIIGALGLARPRT